MKTIKVGAAVIIDSSRIFIAQRGYGEFKGGWEFPGGKVEPNEKSNQTVIREIKEELNANIQVDSFLGCIEYDYPTFHISMDAYLCHLLKDSMELKEHEAAKWVSLNELMTCPLLPADQLIASLLLNNK
ncbi:MAG: (deoxy)nucleoside triphosphate pyrophosphohydrolase [Bacilli bacterium]|jgi:8-oxo-dGTP diphosphatase